jgi:threonine aldolase
MATVHSAPRRHFASDNNAGVHPAILAAIAAANEGHVPGYGDDDYTRRASAVFREHLGDDALVFFMFNGTGANVSALAAALRPHQAVICPEPAHINVDECGAYERFGGGKLIDLPVLDGKLTPADVVRCLTGIGVEHHVQPAAISISQATEFGTIYTLDELRALGDVARKHGLFFHVDGARLANAAAALGASLREMLTETGVDACTFGGTKNGLLYGEAIVFPRGHAAAALMPYVRKSGMQLASKMRFVAAQFEAILSNGLWIENASNANAMAQVLAARVSAIEGVRIAYPVQANAVFAALPPAAIEPLQRERHFYVWDEAASVVRWMASFDTTPDDVESFAAAVRRAVESLR